VIAGGASRMGLRTALIWHDEVMDDLVLDRPRPVTIGHTGRTTFVVPELGLPPKFSIVRPGNRGYLLTLGERMRGTICIAGQNQDVADLVARDSAGGFCATPIGGRDWGVIELDESGDYKLFFQFVPLDEPPQFFTRPVLVAGGLGYLISSAALTLLWYLKGVEIDDAIFRGAGLAAAGMIAGGIAWSLIRQDSESQASLAFSVVLHAALLVMTYQLYEGDNPFVWPGPRSLTANYLVTRLEQPDPPEPKPVPAAGSNQQPAAAATKDPPKNTATKGAEGRAGGKGDIERARDPNAKDVPPEVPAISPGAIRELDNLRNLDRNLKTSLSKFNGIKGPTLTPGAIGFGPGTGTGVGAGEGTGTRTGSKKAGSGGGGNVEGDFVTGPGKIDTGGVRPGGGTCKGAGCGTGPRPVKIDIAPPSGEFGGLTAEEIDRVVRAASGLFKACYQKELNHTPGIGGKVVVHFKIGGDGQPSGIQVGAGTTLHNEAIEECVKARVARLRFPAKGGIANVNYPFVFAQGG
jgi:hypothetical protein